jgi:hypothetical protein
VLALSPNVFIGVEFRGIRREAVHMQSAVTAGRVLLDQTPAMNRTAIPQQHDWLVKMALEVAQKLRNLNVCDVLAMKTNVQPQPAATGRNGRGRYR